MSRFPVPPAHFNPLTAANHQANNQLIRQVNELTSMMGPNGIAVQRGPLGTTWVDQSAEHLPVEFLAVLVDGGPPTSAAAGANQPDFTDSRYWARQIVLNQTQGASTTDSLTASVDASTLLSDGSYGGGLWVVAVNLQESLTGTHLMPLVSASIPLTAPLGATATIVRVQQIRASKWTTLPNDFGNELWVFEPLTNITGGTIQKMGMITGYTGAGPVDWVYQVTFTDGSTANAYNSMEPLNGSPGSLGVDVGTDGNLTGTSCYVKPAGTSPRPRVFTWDAVNSRWSFDFENSAG